MQGKHISIPFRIPGTLTANHDLYCSFPFPVQLVGVSAYTDNALTFILDVGKTGTLEAYVKDKTITGATGTMTQLGRADLVGAEHHHINANTVIVASINYDGGDGANVGIVLHFTEG